MSIHIIIDSTIRIKAGPERLLAAIKQALTIPNPAQIQAERYGRGGWNIPPELTFYRHGDSLTLPRGFLPRLAAMPEWRDATVEDRRLVLPAIAITFRALLRDYQDAAVKAMMGREHGVLQAGTGAGKTVMALAIIAARKQPSLVLVHNKELLNQWRDRTKQFLDIEAGRIGGGRFEVRPVSIGIVNTVRNRLDELTPHFGHIVVDECHRCPSAMFTECVDAFPAKYRLGLSATPYRRDGLTKAIHFYIGPKLHEVDQTRLQREGAILRPGVVTRPTAFRFGGNGADHYQELLTALTLDRHRNALIAGDVKRELARGAGTALVVSDRVAHLEALAACLRAVGVTMDLLTGQTPKAQREAMVERIRAGKVQVLGSTLQLIGEGFDCPGLASLFLATPIKFSGRLLQVVGRILRPQDGKTPRLYDYHDPVGVLQASARTRATVYDRQGFIRHAETTTRGMTPCA